MKVPVNCNDIINDAWAIINLDFPSGEDIGNACTLADWDRDAQFKLLYQMLVAAHARAKIAKADPSVTAIKATVVEAHWNNDEPYAVVDFQYEEDAILYKLSE